MHVQLYCYSMCTLKLRHHRDILWEWGKTHRGLSLLVTDRLALWTHPLWKRLKMLAMYFLSSVNVVTNWQESPFPGPRDYLKHGAPESKWGVEAVPAWGRSLNLVTFSSSLPTLWTEGDRRWGLRPLQMRGVCLQRWDPSRPYSPGRGQPEIGDSRGIHRL